VRKVATTKYPIVPISEVLSNQTELEVNGLAISFRNDETTGPKALGIADRGATAFEVRGLESGYKAWIVQEKNSCHLMRETRGSESEWLGEYPSIDAALRALSNKMSI
jgi:hypothetical protein